MLEADVVVEALEEDLEPKLNPPIVRSLRCVCPNSVDADDCTLEEASTVAVVVCVVCKPKERGNALSCDFEMIGFA